MDVLSFCFSSPCGGKSFDFLRIEWTRVGFLSNYTYDFLRLSLLICCMRSARTMKDRQRSCRVYLPVNYRSAYMFWKWYDWCSGQGAVIQRSRVTSAVRIAIMPLTLCRNWSFIAIRRIGEWPLSFFVCCCSLLCSLVQKHNSKNSQASILYFKAC